MQHALNGLRRSLPVLCLAMAWLPTLAAQNVLSTLKTEAQPATADPSAPQPIPARHIPVRADADEQWAQDLLRRASQPGQLSEYEQELDELADGVRALSRQMRGQHLDLLPAQRLESLQRNWGFFEAKLERWRRTFQRQIDRLSDEAAQLAARRADWEATRESPLAGDLAPALMQRTRDVLRQLEAADRAVSDLLARHLELARRGNSLRATIDSGEREIAAASASFDRRLAKMDEPPLWKAWRETEPSETRRSQVAATLAGDRAFLRYYLAAADEQLWLHGVFALLAIPLLLWLRARSQRLIADDPELKSSTQALLRPVSAWLVLVLVATLVFQPLAPSLLREVALLLTVIPVLRLLPAKVFASLGAWPFAITVLYLFHRLGFVLVGQPLWHRLHLLVVTLLTLGALLSVLLQARRRTPAAIATRRQRILRTIGALALLALAISAASNVVGNVSLAEVLTSGTLDSLYLGFVLYAGATVLASIARLLARRRSTRLALVTEHAGPLLVRFANLVKYGAVVAWLLLTLNGFRVLRPIVEWGRGILTHPFGFGAISLTLGSILLFAVSVYAAFWIARTLREILRDEILGRMTLPRGVANSVASLTYYAVIIFGLLVALAAAGFRVSQLAIVVGALSVGIGFGLQNVVNNFVSGLILMFERPIQPGDAVEISGVSGTVREIGMRATIITTAEGAEVLVPNGTLLSEKLVNWTLRDMNRRLDVDLAVGYDGDVRQVMQLLKQAAVSTPGVAETPEPAVLCTGIGPATLNFAIRAWTNDFNNAAAIRSNLALRVVDALREAGITLPVKPQELTIRRQPREPAAQSLPQQQPQPSSS